MRIKRILAIIVVIGVLGFIGYVGWNRYKGDILLLRNKEELIFKKGKWVAQCHKVFLGRVYFTYRANNLVHTTSPENPKTFGAEVENPSSYHVRLLRGANPNDMVYDEVDCNLAKDSNRVWIAGFEVQGVDSRSFSPVLYKSEGGQIYPSGYYKDRSSVYYIEVEMDNHSIISGIRVKKIEEKPYLFKLAYPCLSMGVGGKGVYWLGDPISGLSPQNTEFYTYGNFSCLAVDEGQGLVYCGSYREGIKRLNLDASKIAVYGCMGTGNCYGDGNIFYDVVNCNGVSNDMVNTDKVIRVLKWQK